MALITANEWWWIPGTILMNCRHQNDRLSEGNWISLFLLLVTRWGLINAWKISAADHGSAMHKHTHTQRWENSHFPFIGSTSTHVSFTFAVETGQTLKGCILFCTADGAPCKPAIRGLPAPLLTDITAAGRNPRDFRTGRVLCLIYVPSVMFIRDAEYLGKLFWVNINVAAVTIWSPSLLSKI